MAGELRHKDVVGGRITEDEFEDTTQHFLNNGVEGDFIYWDDTAKEFKRIAHQDDLDAHTYNIFEQLRTGVYIPTPFYVHYTGSPTVITANRLYATPFPVVRPMTLDALQIYITTGDAGKVMRLGFYAPGTNLAPDALVVDGGEVSVNAAGLKTAVIDESLTALGIYWLAFVSDGTPSVYMALHYISPLGGTNASSATHKGHWYVAHAYGALPDPFGAPTAADKMPKIAVKINSLD